MKKNGLIYAVSAYVLWGFAPIFWKQLESVGSIEIVAHRTLWSFILVFALILASKQWRPLIDVLNDRKTVLRLLMSSLLISLNWAVFIWAINAGYVVESSMGYFINPLISVLFGVIFFKEELRRNQWLAILVMSLGVAYLVVVHGTIPYIALVLAASFASYGAIKKTLTVPATHGLAIETGFLLIPALVYLLYLNSQGIGSFGAQQSIDMFLVFGGLLTLMPLLLFSAAAKKISMTALGMSQYIGPTLILACGVWLYKEPFGLEKQISFGMTWLALLIYSIDQLWFRRRRVIVAKF